MTVRPEARKQARNGIGEQPLPTEPVEGTIRLSDCVPVLYGEADRRFLFTDSVRHFVCVGRDTLQCPEESDEGAPVFC
jgi:hypothetical protein